MINDYNPIVGISYQEPPPPPPSRFVGGSGGSATEFEGLTDAQLATAYKQHRLSPEQYKAELQARGKSQAAIKELLIQNAPESGSSITPPSLTGAGLADPSSGVKAATPFDKLTDAELRRYVEAGVMTQGELLAVKGQAEAALIMAKPLSTADRQAITNLRENPPNIPRYTQGGPQPALGAAAAPYSFPPEVEQWRSLVARHFPPEEVNRALWVIQQESGGQAGVASRFNTPGGENSHGLWQINLQAHPSMQGKTNDPDAATAYAAQLWHAQGWRPWSVTHKGFPAALEGAGSAAAGGPMSAAINAAKGSAGGSTSQPAPPEPPPNSQADLSKRGAIPLQGGKIAILGGQQWQKTTEAVQASDGYYYNVDPNNPAAPLGPRFTTQAEANRNAVYSPVGVAVSARDMSLSPLARAASRGGNVPRIENPLFDLNSIDEMIAAGATRGRQTGDIITTVRPNATKGSPLEVTQGGIPEYGGLRPVSDTYGNVQSYTGQLPGNVTLGVGSPVTGNRAQDLYWMQQASGIPQSRLESLDDAEMRRLHEVIGNRRAAGTMPDLQSLATQWKPSLSGWDLKVMGPNTRNTPYDQAVAALFREAAIQELTYLPQGQGADPLSGLYDYDGSLLTFAKGGSFMAEEPMFGIGALSGDVKFLLGEEGPEKLTIDPMKGKGNMNQYGGIRPDILMGRERQPEIGIGDFERRQFERLRRGATPPQRGGVPAGWIPPGLGMLPPPFRDVQMPPWPPQIPPRPAVRPGIPPGAPPFQPQPSRPNPFAGLLAGLGQGFDFGGWQFPALPPSLDDLKLFGDGGTVRFRPGPPSTTGDPYTGREYEPMTAPKTSFVSWPGNEWGQWTYNKVPAMYKEGYTAGGGQYVPGFDDLGSEGARQFSGGITQGQQAQHRVARRSLGPVVGDPIGYQPYGTTGMVPVYAGEVDAATQSLIDHGTGEWTYVPTVMNGRPAFIRTYRSGPSAGGPPGSSASIRRGVEGLLGGLFGGLFGDGGGFRIDPLLEAQDKRYYETQAPNYAAAGLQPPAILNLEDRDDRGDRFYRRFDGTLPQGVSLPFGYDENARRAWGSWRPQLGSGLG